MKYYIKTFGCQMNASDSERIATFLESLGFTLSLESDRADLIVINTCGVRQTAEDRVFGLVHNIRKKKDGDQKTIIITGCVAHRKDVQRKMKDKVNLFIPIKDFFELEIENLKFIENCNPPAGGQIANSGAEKTNCENDYLNVTPKYKNDKKLLVPVMTGCNNFCSYCVVPHARGREWSRPVDDIIEEIGKSQQNGCEEILLLGQNVNSYKFKNYNFPLLLDLLAELYPAIEFSFLTSHPKDFSDELIDVIATRKNISKQIHLPIQSGSNKILKGMNRHYTQKHYLEIIEKIKEKIPDAQISTDVIVGFPGETLKDFAETKKVFKHVGFCEAFINKYSARPGTAAEKLGDPIPWNEKKRREKILRKLL